MDLDLERPPMSETTTVTHPIAPVDAQTGTLPLLASSGDATRGFGVAGRDLDKIDTQERTLRRRNQETVDRLIALRIVMSRAVGLRFEEVAEILNVRPQRLQAWLHETQTIPNSAYPRIVMVEKLLRTLHSVIKPEGTGRWFALPIPRLDGVTPLDAIRAGHLEAVWQLVESYTDPSFT
jgi:hypothetical protein